MNAIIAGSGSSLPNGWVVFGFCWLVLRVIRRVDDLENAHTKTREALDKLIRALERDEENV